jgi:hypothetical protein
MSLHLLVLFGPEQTVRQMSGDPSVRLFSKVVFMQPGKRFGPSAAQKLEVWSRWKAGQTLHEIGRAFGKEHSSIRCLALRHGGIVPAVWRRSLLSLTLREREEISPLQWPPMWQRSSNEDTNVLLRQYYPKRTNLSGYAQSDLDKVALRLNAHERFYVFRLRRVNFKQVLPRLSELALALRVIRLASDFA